MGVGSRRTLDAGNGFSPIEKQKKMGTRRKREGGEYTRREQRRGRRKKKNEGKIAGTGGEREREEKK
jgi:hypothetical protein